MKLGTNRVLTVAQINQLEMTEERVHASVLIEALNLLPQPRTSQIHSLAFPFEEDVCLKQEVCEIKILDSEVINVIAFHVTLFFCLIRLLRYEPSKENGFR